MSKVFGIGFHKTGTSTLGIILSELGYNVCGVRLDLATDLLNNNFDPIWAVTDKYDAFQDNPWPLLYKELDRRYPDSKFILTYRDEKKWIKSLVNHFGKTETDMRSWIYGVGHPEGNEDIYLKKYRQHNENVIEYFKNDSDKLLVASWEEASDWTDICKFLNKKVPNKPFPHANKGAYKKSEKSIRKIHNAIKDIHRNIFKS